MRDGLLSKRAILGFVLMAALLVSGVLSYQNLHRLSVNEGWVLHTHEVLDELHGVIANLSEAESSQRSYLITGDKSYVLPFANFLKQTQTHLQRIKDLTVDNPVQQARIDTLQVSLADRIASLQHGVTVHDTDGLEAARNYVLQGRGRDEMSAVRKIAVTMEETERSLLLVRAQESRASYNTAIATQLTSTLLGLCLLGSVYVLTVRELETRRQGVKALARANDELEDKVTQRTAALNATNESLARSNRELEQFASVASHDLQEPLRKIQAFGDRLQTRCAVQLGEQGRDYLSRMQSSATRMRSLIDALLTFSRITTKAQPFTEVNLAATAEEVVSDLEERIARSGGRVEIGALPALEADSLQMRQLLQNLIGNGLKFARPGVAPIVQLESRAIEAGDENGAAPKFELTVRDNGIGFEETYLDRIFELFQRLHGRQEYEGTGMGLAICRKIVERHGGAITARSAPGEGATFLVTLPLTQTEPKGKNGYSGKTNHDSDGG